MISVIIPVYNVKNYLEKCVQSILAQTYSDFEAVLVDDGSTDGSGEMCDALALKDGRVKVFHKPNGGLSDARNFGIEHSKGDFLTFVDSDDYVLPNFLYALATSLKTSGADMSCCGFDYVYEDGRKAVPSTQSADAVYSKDDAMDELFFSSNLLQAQTINQMAWGKLAKRSLFDGVRFPNGRLHEDVATTYLLVDRCGNGCTFTCQTRYQYLQRGLSIMGALNSSAKKDKSKNYADMMQTYDEQFLYFSAQKKQKYVDCVRGERLKKLLVGFAIEKEKTTRNYLREALRTNDDAKFTNAKTLKIMYGAFRACPVLYSAVFGSLLRLRRRGLNR